MGPIHSHITARTHVVAPPNKPQPAVRHVVHHTVLSATIRPRAVCLHKVTLVRHHLDACCSTVHRDTSVRCCPTHTESTCSMRAAELLLGTGGLRGELLLCTRTVYE